MFSKMLLHIDPTAAVDATALNLGLEY